VHRLTLVRRPAPETLERLTRKALDRLAHSERAEFADHLDTARTFWRRHRELVEAPEFPEPFRSAYIEENGHEPGDEAGEKAVLYGGEEALAPDFLEQLLPTARRIARAWASRRSPEVPSAS
jgi:hypothetical protein